MNGTLKPLPGCTRCGQPSTHTDVLGLQWCEEHEYRGKLINWGSVHNWSDLQCAPYAIGPGQYCWHVAITIGNDDFIGLAAATTEMLDEQEVA